MRIAFVLARLDCNDGVASHIELLSTELVSRGVSLTMVTGLVTGRDVAPARYTALRRLLPDWHEVSQDQIRPTMKTVRAFASLLRGGRFDLVHAHGLGMLAALRPALLGSGVPVVATYHPSAHGEFSSDFALSFTPRQRLAYRLFLRLFRPDKLIAQSLDTERLFAAECRLPQRTLTRIIGGIDTDHFRPPNKEERAAARLALGVSDGVLTCVLPGRLNLNKGHDVAVAALDQFSAQHPGRMICCFFPGAGAQEAEVRALVAASADPAMFVMPGFVPEMRDVYWASDIVILPSRHEGFALVVAEAMACGCAAIRTPSGGCTDQIVEGETGYAVPYNDPGALAERISRLAEPQRLQTVQAAAARHAKAMFSGQRMGTETVALYGELVRRGGKDRTTVSAAAQAS